MTNFLQDEIKAYIQTLPQTANASFVFELTYPADFTGFQGHFPGDPIVPGVCLLQSLRIGLEQAWQAHLRIAEISKARFLSPVKPEEKLTFNITISERQNGAVSLKAKILRGTERVAEITAKLEELPCE